MRAAPRLGAYAGVLAVVFAAAFAVGGAADPLTATDDVAADAAHGAMAEATTAGDATVPGLAVSQDGYTLVPAADQLPAGVGVDYRFTITGSDGRAVTRYRTEHEKELHLIVVRRDLSSFQHVHPQRGADGTWSVPLDLATGGTYRVLADFTPEARDDGLTLGADLAVAGDYRPAALPAPARTATVDGYEVRLDGTAEAGRVSELTFTVTENGAPVADLQPYLGAYGHLVSLRAGDLAYLHTHPAQEAHAGERGGPQVRFDADFPTAGSYRLFLDFRHDGAVRTAAFTVRVTS